MSGACVFALKLRVAILVGRLLDRVRITSGAGFVTFDMCAEIETPINRDDFTMF